MINKRFLAVVVVVVGALAVVALLLWMFWPVINQKKAQQPPPLQPANPPTRQPATPAVAPTPPPDVNSPAEKERQAQEKLKQDAMDLAARLGTYSNSDSFAALKAMYVDVTPEVQKYLEGERQKLLDAHPAFSASWGQTTRSLSAAITSDLPVLGKDTAEVTVQAQQIKESPGVPLQTSYVKIVLSLKKANSKWVVTHLSVLPLEP